MSAATVRASLTGPATGLIAQVLLLDLLAATAGLGAAGWVVGVACAMTMAAALARGLARGPGGRLGPASWVTLARATLAVGVAALAADSFTRDTPVALLVTLAAVALALDAVDGWVARRTGTASALGARFDGEVDAFLILALSVYVAPAYGAWVLAIGAARYLFLAGEWLLPWMRAPLPPRRWRKVVAAAQGIVLTVAAAEVLPRGAHAGPPGSPRSPRWRRRSASARGGCGAAGTPRATRCRRASPWRSRSSPCCSSGPPSSRRTRRADLDRRRVRAASARAARRRRAGRPAARHPAPRAGRGRGSGAGRARAREGPRHGVLHGLQPAVRPRLRLELRGDRHRDAARRDRQLEREPRRRRRRRARRRAPRPPGRSRCCASRASRPATAAGRSGRRPCSASSGWSSASLGAPVASTSAAALAVDQVQAVQDRPAGSRAARPRDRPRPLPRHARRPAADRPARQGRPARVRRELRQGRGRGLVVLAPRRRRARPGRRAAAGRRLLLAQRLPHLADLRRPQLAGALHPAVGGPGRRPAALRPARREQPPHPHAGVQARRVAGGRRHAGEPPGVAGGLDLLRLRPGLRPPQPRLPRPGLRPASDARPVRAPGPAPPRARQASAAAAVRRGRPHLEPRAVDAHPPAHRRGTTSATARSSAASRRRSPRGPRSSATPSAPAPPTGTRSSTR